MDLASLKALPPIAALCGDLPDDLSDAELAECWAGTVPASRTTWERFRVSWGLTADVCAGKSEFPVCSVSESLSLSRPWETSSRDLSM